MPTEEKPSRNEDEYFVKQDAELLKARRAELDAERERHARSAHYMKCPKCGMDLQTLKRGDVEIDTCFNCHGVFLDAGELERLMQQSGTENNGKWMGAVLNLFKGK